VAWTNGRENGQCCLRVNRNQCWQGNDLTSAAAVISSSLWATKCFSYFSVLRLALSGFTPKIDRSAHNQIPERVNSQAESGTLMDVELSVKQFDIGSLPLRF
jgi:hypothetical protein